MIIDQDLRILLRTARQARGLTQREAAHRAQIDPSWWKKLESGRRVRSQAGTVASMAHAAGVSPADLDKGGWSDIATRLRVLLTLDLQPVLRIDPAEEYIARTPDTTTAEREALILRLRDLRSARQVITVGTVRLPVDAHPDGHDGQVMRRE